MFFVVLCANHLDKDCKYKIKVLINMCLSFAFKKQGNTNIMLVIYMILSENILNKDCSCKAKVL